MFSITSDVRLGNNGMIVHVKHWKFQNRSVRLFTSTELIKALGSMCERKVSKNEIAVCNFRATSNFIHSYM